MGKDYRNACGLVNRTPGQNLATAVMGEWQDIGFPPYNYGKVAAILTQALTTEEFDLVCRGFGLNRARQQQSEIAKELKLDTKAVSTTIAQAIAKLQVSACKKQLRNLIVAPTEIFAKISELEHEAATGRELKATKYRLQAAEEQCKILEAKLDQTTKERNALAEDNKKLARKVDIMATQNTKANTEIARLADLASYHQERERLVKQHLDSTLGEISNEITKVMTEARKSFIAKVGTLEVEKTDGLKTLDINEDTVAELHKIGINSISQLTKLSRHNLSKIGVGSARIADLESGLGKMGLSLRIG